MWKGFSSDYVPPQDTAVFDAGEGQGLMFSPYPVPMISNGSRRLLDNCSQWTLLSNACSIGREVKNLETSSRDATLLQVCVCVCLRASVCAHVCVHALVRDYYICTSACGDQRTPSGVIPHAPSTFGFALLVFRAADFYWPRIYLAQQILLSLPPHGWDYKPVLLCPAFLHEC